MTVYNLSEIIKQLKITCKITPIENYICKNGQCYKCTFRRNNKTFTTYFFQSIDNSQEVNICNIIASIITNCESLEYCKDFVDWCYNFGYKTIDVNAFEAFRECAVLRKKFVNFLGEDNYRKLLQYKLVMQ